MITLLVLMGPSRVYLAAHWPSDVLGSYMLGTALLIIGVARYSLLARSSNPRAHQEEDSSDIASEHTGSPRTL